MTAKVLMWEHKHGTSLYDASTPEALDAAAVQVIRELLQLQYIYEPYEPHLPEDYVELSKVDLEKLDETARKLLEKQVQTARSELQRLTSEYKYEREDYDEATKIVEAGKTEISDNGSPASWRFLQRRSGYEYELFSLVKVWTAGT